MPVFCSPFLFGVFCVFACLACLFCMFVVLFLFACFSASQFLRSHRLNRGTQSVSTACSYTLRRESKTSAPTGPNLHQKVRDCHRQICKMMIPNTKTFLQGLCILWLEGPRTVLQVNHIKSKWYLVGAVCSCGISHVRSLYEPKPRPFIRPEKSRS